MKYDVSIIYVYYNTPTELSQSIQSLSGAVGNLKYEVVIVDNDSPRKIPKKFFKVKNIQIVKNKNNGYGAGLNLGASVAGGSCLVLSNPDVVFKDNSIAYLVSKLKEKKVGAVGPQMIDEKGSTLRTISGEPTLTAFLFGTSVLGRLFRNSKKIREFRVPHLYSQKERQVKVISGACIAIKSAVFKAVGGFDERFFMYFEEDDFCKRIRKKGLSVIYFPKAKVFHKVGASSQDKEFIETKYSESRYKFFKKYNSFITATAAEIFFRLTTFSGLLLAIALIVSLFLNLFKIESHMLFIGDFGRDFLAARDMVVTGNIPLVGIPSSVVWLHQGPLSIYFIAFSFFISNFNPIAPGIFYALVGSATVYLVYHLSKLWFGRRAASIIALFYATSPLIIMSARMPYHTSSIPFFTALFFIFLTFLINGRKKFLAVTSFNLGILLLLELSNAVLILLVSVLFLISRPKFKIKDAVISIVSFLVGVSPFILYDLTHSFVQTLGFPIWIVNRIRLFLGFAAPEKVTSGEIPEALMRIWQQITGIIFPENKIVVVAVVFLILILVVSRRKEIFKFRKTTGFQMTILWMIIPLFGFLVHAAPGTAYFPLLFPPISILVGLSFYRIYLKYKLAVVVFFAFCFLNAFLLLKNEYYLTTKTHRGGLPPFNYNYGMGFSVQDEAVRFIVDDAQNHSFSLKGGGFLGTLNTGVDGYKYLSWYRGGQVRNNAQRVYVIHEGEASVKKTANIVFNNSIIFIEKK